MKVDSETGNASLPIQIKTVVSRKCPHKKGHRTCKLTTVCWMIVCQTRCFHLNLQPWIGHELCVLNKSKAKQVLIHKWYKVKKRLL